MLLPAGVPFRSAEPGIVKPAFDPALASPFRMDWLVPLDGTTADDYTRAVAEKADVLLRGAQFIDMQHLSGGHDVEVRLWIEAALGPACVSITWEPGVGRYGFHLLDETLKERLACIVFEGIPCVDAEESVSQADRVMDAAIRALAEATARGHTPADWAEDVRHAMHAVRLPIHEGPRNAEPGSET